MVAADKEPPAPEADAGDDKAVVPAKPLSLPPGTHPWAVEQFKAFLKVAGQSKAFPGVDVEPSPVAAGKAFKYKSRKTFEPTKYFAPVRNRERDPAMKGAPKPGSVEAMMAKMTAQASVKPRPEWTSRHATMSSKDNRDNPRAVREYFDCPKDPADSFTATLMARRAKQQRMRSLSPLTADWPEGTMPFGARDTCFSCLSGDNIQSKSAPALKAPGDEDEATKPTLQAVRRRQFVEAWESGSSPKSPRRKWNPRWHVSISQFHPSHIHPFHRELFEQPSPLRQDPWRKLGSKKPHLRYTKMKSA
mmetsp:Transcript_52449/g.139116  ORF Transcript_52449/g.139116 Transcript_52449/m.139116 type:complete len:304 (+) Transcript_52449:50-961(+)